MAIWLHPDPPPGPIPDEPTFVPQYPGQLTEVGDDGWWLAERPGGRVVLAHPTLPEIPLARNSAVLQLLNNADIRRLGLGVPCRERRSPWEPYPADWPKRRAGAGTTVLQ